MLCGSSYRILTCLPVLRFLNLRLDRVTGRSMSVALDNMKLNKEDKSNKRQMTDDNDEVEAKVQKLDETDIDNGTQRIKKKKYAMMLCYLGKNYYGMQKNPQMKTIEDALFKAMLEANLITLENYENVREIKFQRAARTDKGVSAVRQIVSLKLPQTVDKAEINKYLPKEIRVFGIKRVTKHFNCKVQCNARTYRYVIPTYAFAPEHVNFIEAKEEIDEVTRLEQLRTINGKAYQEFRLSTEMLNKLNALAKLFEGTHNFHNFTSKLKPLDPRTHRYVISFQCKETFISNDIEFAVLEIKGQSFVLHQIRKMVALLIGITRNIVTEDIMNEIFKVDKYCIPIAPSSGLCLNYVHYDNYNKRYGTDGIHEVLDWAECDKEVENFEKEYILKDVVDMEVANKTLFTWLAEFNKPHRFMYKNEEFVAL